MGWSPYVLTTPLFLLLLWFGVSAAIRVGQSLVERALDGWAGSPGLAGDAGQRQALRARTISGALKGLLTVVLVIMGVLLTLGLFSVPTYSILAGGAVIGLAVSLGSQNLVKDLVHGCLILLEDQYAIGDIIEVGGRTGLVENLNLRITQLRNSQGHLITVPNSLINDVINTTRDWAQVDLAIQVAGSSDPHRVMAVLWQVAEDLRHDPSWRQRLPHPPEVLGIEDLSPAGITLRVWLKTTPMAQWSVARELRLRVQQAFTREEIRLA
nr:mechanosensitive ion channel family protein [Synechococcus sp. CCY 9618]